MPPNMGGRRAAAKAGPAAKGRAKALARQEREDLPVLRRLAGREVVSSEWICRGT